MTKHEILEIQKYRCENCCNFDKEHVLPDGYAKCKLTGIMTLSQECGKDCKCFNVPAENVVIPPCKVGDIVYEVDLPEYGIITCKVKKVSYINSHLFGIETNKIVSVGTVEVIVMYGHGMGSEYYFEFDDFGKTVFLIKEEAKLYLSKLQSSKKML